MRKVRHLYIEVIVTQKLFFFRNEIIFSWFSKKFTKLGGTFSSVSTFGSPSSSILAFGFSRPVDTLISQAFSEILIKIYVFFFNLNAI